ncbi:stathmin domain-containing protein 1 isoform X2 [Paroedura picta]|uniref:stathmin domain-containing protein 1 isoform X2 n=1 Tax=Paroedura picta TaxID=143630 RepID=UPI004055FFD2
MGCSLSSKATGDQPSSKNEQHGKETNKKPKKNASLATVNTSPPRESVAEDSSYEGRLPGSITETLSLPKETNYEQNTVIRGESAKKPVGLTERERQTSADILEELRTQGIIKTASGAPQIGQGDDTMLIATPRKLPAKLEKLESKRQKENDLTIMDIESDHEVS